jgi:tetratricopeptide (TPR) repeat protein
MIGAPLIGMVLYAAVAAAPAAAPTPAGPAATIALEPLIGLLIRDLGSDSFESREKATEALRRIGPAARGEIEKASESKDPEIRLRALRILGDLKFGIEPGWPAEAVLMARRYDQMNDYEKQSALTRIAQLLGRKAVPFLIQRLISDDARSGERAYYALQSISSEEAARMVLLAIREPKNPWQVRALTWAQARGGLPLETLRVRPVEAKPPVQNKAAEAGVAKLLDLLKQRKFEAMKQAAVELEKALPKDARLAYLEAEALSLLGKEPEAKAARARAAEMNPDDKSAHAAAAETLQRLGRRVAAAAEWEKVLKIAPAGGAPDINAQIQLGVIYSASGLFERAAKYMQTAHDLCQKEGKNVIIEIGIAETPPAEPVAKTPPVAQPDPAAGTVPVEGWALDLLRLEISKVSRKAQAYPVSVEAALEDDLVGRETTVAVEVTAKDDKLAACRKAMADVACVLSLDIQPRDLKLFDEVPATLKYDAKQHQILILLADTPCCKPLAADLGDKAGARVGVETPAGWFVFKVNTGTGEALLVEQFEKVYTVAFKPPILLMGLLDSVWTVNGKGYPWEEIQKGVTMEVLPTEFWVSVEGTTADKRRLTSTFVLPAGQATMAPPAPEKKPVEVEGKAAPKP